MFSARVDLNNDRLIDSWRRDGGDVWRVNYDGSAAQLTCDPASKNIVLIKDGVQRPLSDFDRVWIRTLPQIEWSPEIAETFRAQELRTFFTQILLWLSANWLNFPDKIQSAQSKIQQLHLAAQLGLMLPDSRFTTTLHDGEMLDDSIIKTFTGGIFAASGEAFTMPTTLASSLSSKVNSPLLGTPLIYQKRIRGTDARVFWIDGGVYAVSILKSDAAVDWRTLPAESLEMEPVEVPPRVSIQIKEFMTAIDCRIGALDFIILQTGDWCFLEVNIMGNWVFFEDIGGIPITNSIISALKNLRAS